MRTQSACVGQTSGLIPPHTGAALTPTGCSTQTTLARFVQLKGFLEERSAGLSPGI